MLLTITEFRNRVRTRLPELVAELQAATGRSSPEEAAAWEASLPAVSNAFGAPFFQPLHLYFGTGGGLCLEYRLPASSSWCDMVLLGAHGGKPSAAILELKHWEMTGDLAGPNDRLIRRHSGLQLHPADQVRGYVEYCRHFHSTVLACEAATHGCVLFTKDQASQAYVSPPYRELVEEFPCFSVRVEGERKRLAEYFGARLTAPDPKFAEAFVTGWYDQNRSFVRNIAGTIARSTDKPLVLLDRQRFGYALARAEIERAIEDDGGDKKVIIVIGPPGSGKSVIAAKVWADIVDGAAPQSGRCVLTSTSKAQETNWTHLFRTVAGHHGAGGVVMPANKYAPAGLRALGEWQRRYPGAIKKPALWRETLEWLRNSGEEPAMPDDHFLVSVIDEAHALINPEHTRAITNSGWPNNLGPQAYHIIRASRVSVFFLDPKQGFRERESTSVEDIETWAKELGVKEVTRVSLEGTQFRCSGSVEYVDWIEALLDGKERADCARLARAFLAPGATPANVVSDALGTAATTLNTLRRNATTSGFSVRVCPSLDEMEQLLRSKIDDGATARLVASFARPWNTEGHQQPHDLPPGELDFYFAWSDGSRKQTWSRPWNVTPRNDYSHFIQAVPGTRIASDNLAEVGCTYAVRGFDFDYVGLLWLEDLAWVGTRWVVNLEHVHESGLHSTLRSARRRRNPDLRDRDAVLDSVMQAYRILLTRAIKGVYVWFADPSTRDHVMAALGVSKDACH